MNTFPLFTAEAWRKYDVEVIQYDSEIRINKKHFEKKLDIPNIVYRTQYYSSELKKKKMRWKYKSVVNINFVELLLKILWH